MNNNRLREIEKESVSPQDDNPVSPEVSAKPAEKGDTKASSAGALTVKEDRVEGQVSWETYKAYMKAGGGYPVVFLVIFSFILAQAIRVAGDWWLAVWVDHNYTLSGSASIGLYAAFVVGWTILSLLRAFLYTKFAMVAARGMHDEMAKTVLRSPQVFFDQNPVGRILNRFSKDQSYVDGMLPNTAQTTFELFMACSGTVVIVAILIPWFLLCLPPVLILFRLLQKVNIVLESIKSKQH